MFDTVERTYDSEKEKRVVQMYESGRYLNAIEEETGVYSNKIYSILEKYGIKKRNTIEDKTVGEKLEEFSDETIDKVIKLYQDDSYTVTDIVNTIPGITLYKMYKIIDSSGIERRVSYPGDDNYLDRYPDYVIDMIKEMYPDDNIKVNDILDILEDIDRNQFYKIVEELGLEKRRSRKGGEEKSSSQVGGIELSPEVKDSKEETKIETVSQDIKSISIKNGSMKFKKGDIEMDITGDIEIKFN
jgi:hypothetical protein